MAGTVLAIGAALAAAGIAGIAGIAALGGRGRVAATASLLAPGASRQAPLATGRPVG